MCDRGVSANRYHRYKGIENFFRRLAHNLGNSPSQTEVKVISCVPIDVTDLQLRICELERLLECERKKACRLCTRTALYTPKINYNEPFRLDTSNSKINELKNSSSLGKEICEQSSSVRIPENMNQNCHVLKVVQSNCITAKPMKGLFKNDNIVYFSHIKKQPIVNDHTSFGHQNVRIRNKQQNLPFRISDSTTTISVPICRDNIDIEQRIPLSNCALKDVFDKENNFYKKPIISENNYVTSTTTINSFYDENFYDVVPVKECSTTREKSKPREEIERVRGNLQYLKNKVTKPDQELALKKYKIEKVMNSMAYNEKCCLVECGGVYAKKKNAFKNYKLEQRHKKISKKVTDNKNYNIKKLNEIKDLLKSVLHEVQSQANANQITIEKIKNLRNRNQSFCSSPNTEIPASRDMKTKNYSYLLPCCSMYPQPTYPLIVQQPAHPCYTTAYFHQTNDSIMDNGPPNKKQDNVANNLKPETEKLIKQIYDSMNLHMKSSNFAPFFNKEVDSKSSKVTKELTAVKSTTAICQEQEVNTSSSILIGDNIKDRYNMLLMSHNTNRLEEDEDTYENAGLNNKIYCYLDSERSLSDTDLPIPLKKRSIFCKMIGNIFKRINDSKNSSKHKEYSDRDTVRQRNGKYDRNGIHFKHEVENKFKHSTLRKVKPQTHLQISDAYIDNATRKKTVPISQKPVKCNYYHQKYHIQRMSDRNNIIHKPLPSHVYSGTISESLTKDSNETCEATVSKKSSIGWWKKSKNALPFYGSQIKKLLLEM